MIPCGYNDENLKKFLDAMDCEGQETKESLKVENADLPDGLEVVVLNKN